MSSQLGQAETALAIIGAVLWAVLVCHPSLSLHVDMIKRHLLTIQPIPQIIKSFRLKSTKGLSPLLMLWVINFAYYREPSAELYNCKAGYKVTDCIVYGQSLPSLCPPTPSSASSAWPSLYVPTLPLSDACSGRHA